MTTSNRPLPSEEVYGEKWDRCLKDTAVKTGGHGVFNLFKFEF
jgi:hypothetical protein